MKKIYLLAVCLHACLFAYTQDTFQKTYGGAFDDFAYTVKQLPDSGFILTGSTSSLGAGTTDVYILRTNKYGDTLWTKTYGGAADDFSYFIEQTSDNGFIITGSSNSFGFGVLDVLLIKTDSNGDTLWTRVYGGIDYESGTVVHETPYGEYIVAGFTESSGAGGTDVYLLKTDVNGNLLWAKTYGDTAAENAYAMELTSDGGYILAGSTFGMGAGSYDVLLINTDSSGTILWSKTYGGTGTDEAYTILQTPDKGYLVGGTTIFGAGNYDDYLFKTDSAGNLSWSKTYGGATDREYINYIRPAATFGNYVFAGTTGSFGTGGENVHLLQIDGSGNLAWSKHFGGTMYDDGFGMDITNDNGIVICGRTESFGSGNFDAYLIKTDSAGNSGCNNSSDSCIVTSPPTSVSTVTIAAAPGGAETISSPIMSSGGTITTLCQLITGTEEQNEEIFSNKVLVYPNPFSNEATISIYDFIPKHQDTIYDFVLYDITGREVIKFAITDSESEIQRGNLKAGMYYYRVKHNKNGIANGKVIIE